MMRLGIINGWDEGHFKTVSEKGLTAVEFCINYNYDSAEVLARAEEIKGYSEKYGVDVASIGRWGMTRVDENGDIIPEALQHDKNLVDLASILGCPVFNVGCNEVEGKTFEENCKFAINYLQTLVDYAMNKDIPYFPDIIFGVEEEVAQRKEKVIGQIDDLFSQAKNLDINYETAVSKLQEVYKIDSNKK